MGNFDGELNELKGAPENDGLVAKESQYYPRTFTDPNTGEVRNVHPNVLGGDAKGYIGYSQYNHKDIDKSEDVKSMVKKMIGEAAYKRTN
jgi:hypothetical protein